jgi:hypothetical protein
MAPSIKGLVNDEIGIGVTVWTFIMRGEPSLREAWEAMNGIELPTIKAAQVAAAGSCTPP